MTTPPRHFLTLEDFTADQLRGMPGTNVFREPADWM